MRLRAPWPLKALCLLVLVCCCTHSRVEQHDTSAEVQLATHAENESISSTHAAAEEVEKRTEGPTSVATTKDQLGVVVQDAAGAVSIARIGRKPLVLPKGSRIVGTVPLAETKRQEERGPVVDEKASAASKDIATEANGASTATLAAKSKDKGSVEDDTHVGPPWWVWLVGAVVLVAAIAGAGVAAWKLKPPWLGWLWKLLKVAR